MVFLTWISCLHYKNLQAEDEKHNDLYAVAKEPVTYKGCRIAIQRNLNISRTLQYEIRDQQCRYYKLMVKVKCHLLRFVSYHSFFKCNPSTCLCKLNNKQLNNENEKIKGQMKLKAFLAWSYPEAFIIGLGTTRRTTTSQK